ncbi:hypothetical protein ACT4MK_19315 [Bradyrhizobium barranii]|uniref:hypothetical protein n=1 Tax=Bradyrhizobium TaxID=374 RepID=UPI003F28A40E
MSKRKGPYYPGAEVWQHPDAERVFAVVNDNRRMMKAPPLARDKASTEDVVRERLQRLDKSRRQSDWWRRKREATS